MIDIKIFTYVRGPREAGEGREHYQFRKIRKSQEQYPH